jgi:hypothetical protein
MNLLKKDATVSHTIYPNDNRAIYLNDNPISDQVVIGLAKHLKDAKVSHTIHLAGNEFGGVIDLIELKDTRLENVLKNAKVSHTISVAEMIDKYTYGYIGEKEQKDIML